MIIQLQTVTNKTPPRRQVKAINKFFEKKNYVNLNDLIHTLPTIARDKIPAYDFNNRQFINILHVHYGRFSIKNPTSMDRLFRTRLSEADKKSNTIIIVSEWVCISDLHNNILNQSLIGVVSIARTNGAVLTAYQVPGFRSACTV